MSRHARAAFRGLPLDAFHPKTGALKGGNNRQRAAEKWSVLGDVRTRFGPVLVSSQPGRWRRPQLLMAAPF
jgi:hypothetical protein